MNAITTRYTDSVLIAEDNEAMRELLAASFDHAGIDVDVVGDGEQLRRRLMQGQVSKRLPRVIVSDIYMPRRTGLEVLQWLRDRYDGVQVILITAFGDERTHRRAKKLGAVTVLDKPFVLSELLALVQRLLGNAERPAALEPAALRDGLQHETSDHPHP